jgi:hypothetical protein
MMGDWVGPIACLDAVVLSNNSCPHQESNLNSLAVQLYSPITKLCEVQNKRKHNAE